MASRNVETLRATIDAWNRRDFDNAFRNISGDLVYTDHARALTMNTLGQYREWSEGWTEIFSDAWVTDPEYIDAGDTVIMRFTGRGTNDGPFGNLPPTGRTMSLACCEVWRFDRSGRIISGEIYYDQYSMLTQLGHLKPFAAAA